MSEQLFELQSQLAFQEDLLDQLNAVVARQQQQIDLLQRELLLQVEKLQELNERLAERRPGAIEDERPPHY